jgi:hypothetical protein
MIQQYHEPFFGISRPFRHKDLTDSRLYNYNQTEYPSNVPLYPLNEEGKL